MLRIKVIVGSVVILGLTLSLAGQVSPAADGMDRAMQAFTQAVQSRDSQGVLAAFSPGSPWKYVLFSSTDGKRKIEGQVTITYAEMARDFKARRGNWYYKFIENRPTEHFCDEYFRGQKWLRHGNTLFPGPKETSGLYIKWRRQ